MSSEANGDRLDLEDLADLGVDDLRAVFRQVGPERVILALADVEPELRRRLLMRWSRKSAAPMGQEATPDQVRLARGAVLEALCRLSRGGQIAYDHPDDILDRVA